MGLWAAVALLAVASAVAETDVRDVIMSVMSPAEVIVCQQQRRCRGQCVLIYTRRLLVSILRVSQMYSSFFTNLPSSNVKSSPY